MIGLVICCHGRMGAGMLHAAEQIVGPQAQVLTLEVNPGAALEELTERLLAAVREVDAGDGVLVLTDMPGGTPCNLAFPHLEPGRLAMITGFNLPALVKLLTTRGGPVDLAQLADLGAAYGRRHTLTGEAIDRGGERDREE